MPLTTLISGASARGYGARLANVFSPIIDSLSVGSSGAFSTRKLRAAYTGSAIRVRRSNDNTESDIGFDSAGNLNETALASFVGANSGFVTKWYDQSGNARDVVQTTAAKQPRIVNAGVIDKKNGRPVLIFSGAQGLTNASALNYTGSGLWTANGVAYTTTTATTLSFVDADAGPTLNRMAQFLRTLSNAKVETIAFSSGGTINYNAASTGTISANSMYVATGVRPSGSVTIYLNGTAGATLATASVSTMNPTFNIGQNANSPAGTFMSGGAAEVLMFASGISDADRNLLERQQGAYYGVSVA